MVPVKFFNIIANFVARNVLTAGFQRRLKFVGIDVAIIIQVELEMKRKNTLGKYGIIEICIFYIEFSFSKYEILLLQLVLKRILNNWGKILSNFLSK